MTFRRLSIATLSVAMCASFAAGQEVEIEQADDAAEAVEAVAIGMAQDAEQMLTSAVSKELKLAGKLAGISDAQIKKIMTGLKPTIKKRAKSEENPGIQVTLIGALDDKMLDAVLKAVKAEAKDTEKLSTYEDDLKLRKDFRRKAVVSSFVQTLDCRVGLGVGQIKAAREAIGNMYEAGKLPEEAAYGMITSDDQPVKLGALKEILTENQQRYYNKFSQWQPFGAMDFDENGKPIKPDEKAEREKLMGHLRMVAEMKLDSLDRALELTEKQKKKLRLVSKGVLSSAADEKMAAKKAFLEYQERMMAGAGGAMQGADLEVMNKATSHPVETFVAQPRWSRFVTATLTDAQKKRMAEITAVRQKRATKVLCNTLVLSLGSEMQLSGQQQVAMSDLLGKHVTAPPEMTSIATSSPVEMYRGLLAVKDKEWVEAIGEDNLAQFNNMLGPLRQMIEQMDSKPKRSSQ